MRDILITFFTVLIIVLALPANSQLHGCFGSDTSPYWIDPPTNLSPWFEIVKYKINRLLLESKTYKFHNGARVAFLLDNDGQVVDPMILSYPKGDEKDDQKLLDLIRTTELFDKPPAELLHKQRLLLMFADYPKFSLQLDGFQGYKLWKDRDQTFQDWKRSLEKNKRSTSTSKD
jgi:hypothetical protein